MLMLLLEIGSNWASGMDVVQEARGNCSLLSLYNLYDYFFSPDKSAAQTQGEVIRKIY